MKSVKDTVRYGWLDHEAHALCCHLSQKYWLRGVWRQSILEDFIYDHLKRTFP